MLWSLQVEREWRGLDWKTGAGGGNGEDKITEPVNEFLLAMWEQCELFFDLMMFYVFFMKDRRQQWQGEYKKKQSERRTVRGKGKEKESLQGLLLFLLCALLHEWRQGLELERNRFQLHLINTIKIQLLPRTAATAWKDCRLWHHIHIAKAEIFQCTLACIVYM